MNCINYSSPEYKSLLRDSGLNQMELDGAILAHQKENNIDTFPSLESVKLNIPENIGIQKDINVINKLNNEGLLLGGSNLSNGLYLNTTANEIVSQDDINQIKEIASDYNVNFVKDVNETHVFLNNKTDRLTRDNRAISGTMFQNIVERMSEIVPGLKVQGLANADFIEFANENGINESYNSPTFIVGDTVYYNSQATALTNNMAIEESLHPIVYGIQTENPQLFNDLFNEAKKYYPELWNEIKSTYKQHQSNELVTQALAREFADIDNNKISKNVILRALEAIKKFLNRLFNYNSKSVTESPKMALRAIVEDLNTKSEMLTPSYTFESAYTHQLSDKYTGKSLNKVITKNNWMKHVNKTANSIRTAMDRRGKFLNIRASKANKALDDHRDAVNKMSDAALDSFILSKRVDLYNGSTEYIDLIKGQAIIGDFIQYVYEQLSNTQQAISQQTSRLRKGLPISWTYEDINALQNELIYWWDVTSKPLFEMMKFDEDNPIFDSYNIFLNLDVKNKEELANKEHVKDILKDKFDQIVVMRNVVKKEADMLNNHIIKQLFVEEYEKAGYNQTEIDLLINELDSTYEDSSRLMQIAGSLNAAKDPVLKALGFEIQETEHEHGQILDARLIDFQNAMKEYSSKYPGRAYNLYNIVSEFITDSKGKRTKSGNFISDLNYGQFEYDINNALDKLFKEFGLEDHKDSIKLQQDDRIAYNKARNAILDKYGDRKFIKEYYDALAELDPIAVQLRDTYNRQIQILLKPFTDENGNVHEERMGSIAVNRYEKLKKQKRNLANKYDEDGNEKTGIMKVVAESISKFNDKLMTINDKATRADLTNFNKQHQELINNLSNAKTTEERLKASIELDNFRKTKARVTIKQEFWDDLQKVEGTEYGNEYEVLQKYRSELLKTHRNTYNLEQTVGSTKSVEFPMSDELKRRIKAIDKKLANIRQEYFNKYQRKNKKKGPKFDKYAKITESSEYTRIKNSFIPGSKEYNDWFNDNHYPVNTRDGVVMTPYSFWQIITPLDQSYYDFVPSNLHEDSGQTSNLINKNYNADKAVNTSDISNIVPKKSLYDNSVDYNKIQSDPDLKRLYDLMRNTMTEAQALISNDNNSVSSLLMPQQTAGMIKRFVVGWKEKSKLGWFGSVFKGMRNVASDWFISDRDDPYYNYEDAVTKKDLEKSRYTHPQSALYLPKYYNSKLNNPDMLTRDVIGSIMEYYKMALNYDAKLKRLPKIMALKNFIENKEYISGKNRVETEGAKSKSYSVANAAIDMMMFSRNTRGSININPKEFNTRFKWLNNILNKIFDSSYKISFAKPFKSLQSIIRSAYLSFNLNSIVGDTIESNSNLLTEATAGRYFDLESYRAALLDTTKSSGDWLFTPGDRKSDKMTRGMMLFKLGNYDRNSYNDMHLILPGIRNIRSIKSNTMFAGWIFNAHMTSSIIYGSVMRSHKVFNGELLNKNGFLRKYYRNDREIGEVAWKAIDNNLYDMYDIDQKTRKFRWKSKEYEKIFNDNYNYLSGLMHKINSPINAELRLTDRSTVQNNLFGSFLFMFRNFIIANMVNNFSPTGHDFYSRQYEVGNIRGFGEYIKSNFFGIDNKIYGVDMEQITPELKEEFENSQRMLRKAMLGKGMIGKASKYFITGMLTYISSMIIASMFKSAADDDDRKDDLAWQYGALQTARIQNEIGSKFNPLEMFDIAKNPIVVMNYLDAVTNIEDWFDTDKVKSGIYKGKSKWQRQLIKHTPIRSIYEQSQMDPLLYRRRYGLIYGKSVVNKKWFPWNWGDDVNETSIKTDNSATPTW